MNPKKFGAVLEKKRFFYRVSLEKLAETIGVSYRTFQRKRKEPQRFKLGEVEILMKVLKFTDEERKEALL